MDLSRTFRFLILLAMLSLGLVGNGSSSKYKCKNSDPSREGPWDRRVKALALAFRNLPEECKRRSSWETNVKFIEDFALRQKKVPECQHFNLGENTLVDKTDDELKILRGFKKFRGFKGFKAPVAFNDVGSGTMPRTAPSQSSGSHGNITVDYVVEGIVSNVKDQGLCGSCWAFASTGAMESQLAKTKKTFVYLSEQELVDCSNSTYESFGCDGGVMDGAFAFVNDNGGIVVGEAYPYTATSGPCNTPAYSRRYTCKDYIWVPESEEALLRALLKLGPISCGMDGSLKTFALYTGGVYWDPDCSNDLNHAVLIVGAGTTIDGTDYWLVKNSWGTNWGEYGYFRIRRGINLCNIVGYCVVPIRCC